jgi:4-alpha-glucanotransferase
VVALKEHFGLPGMKILQFGFGLHTPTCPDAPHNHEQNCVVYTGTHDNNTTRGWFEAGEAGPGWRRVLGRDGAARSPRTTLCVTSSAWRSQARAGTPCSRPRTCWTWTPAIA